MLDKSNNFSNALKSFHTITLKKNFLKIKKHYKCKLKFLFFIKKKIEEKFIFRYKD